jgi:nicotinamide-nucleotide amidase
MDFLLPYLRKKYSSKKKVIKHKTLHTIGISESLLYETIGDISSITGNHNNGFVKLAFLPSNYETRLRISVEAKREADADSAIRSAERKLIKKAGRFIYSRDESSIAETVGKLLGETSQTISAAESCTGGLIASKITDVAGSSDYFLEGVITYSNSSKNKLLGVKNSTLRKYGAVSNQTAVEMAKGIRRVSGSDIGISTTGIAGPSGGTKSKPVGLVWIGYSDKNISFAKDFIFTKQRLRNKEIMSKMALEIVRRQLTMNNLQ